MGPARACDPASSSQAVSLILLDTHVLLWAATDDRRLGRKARARIEKARALGEALVSAAILGMKTGPSRLDAQT